MKLGRYEVVRELGKGAMGIVYLAKDPLIGRLVALKTIRSSAHADDDEAREFQQRFIREAQAAGILNHPSIVTVHDIGQDEANGTSFIAMEYVEGQNLKEVLAQGRTLSFEQIGDLVAQVAEALDFAHAKGIVHRDVKPANIILLDGNRAKITDFGIAKIAAGGGANLTSTGQFLGTPNYMAPEQIKGAPVDGRTDIFALGICLYECLTRRKPFGGDSLTSISYKIVHEPFPPLHEINPQIPDGFEDVVAHCLAKDPSKRYQRARDLSNALRQVIRGERPVRPPDPMLADETIVTRDRDRDKIPTLEVPFPDAVEAAPPDVGGSTRPAAAAKAAAAAAPAVARAPREPVARKLQKTLTNVRALPAWRRRIPPALFVGLVAILVAGVLSIVVAARTEAAYEPEFDAAAYAQAKQKTALRKEVNALVKAGRLSDAHAKLQQLHRAAPNAAWAATTLQQIDSIRVQEEVSKQQQALSQQKFDEGKALFDQKKFAASIPLFEESFRLNPNKTEASEFVRLAQAEEQKLQQAKLARRTTTGARNIATATTATTGTPQTSGGAPGGDGGSSAVNDSPAQFTTFFNHPFTDGTIIVRVGADIVLRAELGEERGRAVFRRRVPRVINTASSITPKNADVQVWVNVPSQRINEYHVMPQARFQPGSAHRLVVGFDRKAKTFSYDFH